MLNSKPAPYLRLMLLATAMAAGAIVASTALAQSAPAAAITGDPESGAELFESTCDECHGSAATGPSLRGIIGRAIASVASFDGYSEALKARKSMSWTVENLSAFLKAPSEFIPGTLMKRAVADTQSRADLIAYLASLPPPRSN